MPKIRTRETPPVVLPTSFAAGLHHSKRARFYLFDEFRSGYTVKRLLRIGRGQDCDIRITDQHMSVVHGVLERRQDGATVLHDHSSTNGIYVNGERIQEPVILLVGMHVRIGETDFMAADKDGTFPIAATTVNEFCCRASVLYGSNTEAAKHIGRSREFIRRQSREHHRRSRT